MKLRKPLKLFMMLVSVEGSASEALDKAIEAGYKRVGLEHSYEQLVKYGEYKAVIWGIDKEVWVIGYCVKSIRSESLRISYGNNSYIEIYKDRVQVRIPF